MQRWSRYALPLSLAVLGAAHPALAHAEVIGKDKRQVLLDYYRQKGISNDLATQPYAASQRIMCNTISGSATLIERGDIVLTARHVFMTEPAQQSYSAGVKPNRCSLEVSDGERSQWYPINVKSAIFSDSKQRSFVDRFDWVVLQLQAPVPGVKPYPLAAKPVQQDTSVTLVTMHQDGFKYVSQFMRVHQTCKVRTWVKIDGIDPAGYKLDCSAGIGASGSAVLVEGTSGPEVAGVASSTGGIKGQSCNYDPRRCFAYAVAITDDIRAAVGKLLDSPPKL
jgi:hypothetical protein